MKLISSFLRLLVYSNLFVSLCVAAYTHLTYILFDLPQENAPVITLMVFSFTYITYNGQRLFRLKRKVKSYINIGGRLHWVLKHQKPLIISSIIIGLAGTACLPFINLNSWLLLIPMGGLSLFYVAPLPLIKKGLRDLSYLKVFIIALVWSLIIVALPFVDSQQSFIVTTPFLFALAQCFLFILAITLPFDIRDMKFDRINQLKTIPQFLGVINTILLSELLIFISWALYLTTVRNIPYIIGLSIGHLLTNIIIAFASEKRKEMYFAGWVESTVLLMYLAVISLNYLFAL